MKTMDATPLRKRLKLFTNAGYSVAAVARAVDLPAPTLYCIESGQTRRCTPVIAERVMNVTAGEVKRTSVLLDATPTVQRLQHLMVMGWTQTAISAEAGISQALVSLLLLGGQKVTPETEILVHRCFKRLWQVDGGSARARAHALRRGYQSIMAWDAA